MEDFLVKLKELLEGVEGADIAGIEADLRKLVNEDESKRLLLRNKDLDKRNKEMDRKIKELELEISKLDADEFQRLKEFEEETLKTGNKEIDIEDIKNKVGLKYQNQLNVKEQELTTANEALKKANKKLEDMLIDKELNKQFAKGKRILEGHREILKEFFKNRVIVEEEDGEKALYIKDGTQELPIEDYFEYWKGTDKAKQYLEAEQSSGAGSTNSKTSFKSKKTWKEMTVTERVELFRVNPEEYHRRKKENK